MTLPKKGLRKIIVDGSKYAWSASGNDGWIGLTVSSSDCNGQKLTAKFSYHSILKSQRKNEDGILLSQYQQRLVITPRIVRKVILYGLKIGWRPKTKGAQIDLFEMDDKIDLELKKI